MVYYQTTSKLHVHYHVSAFGVNNKVTGLKLIHNDIDSIEKRSSEKYWGLTVLTNFTSSYSSKSWKSRSSPNSSESCFSVHLQLEKLLAEVRTATLEGRINLIPVCFFVFNKWDQVPEKEVNEVQNHVIRKLKKCWPGLDPKSQITYVSTKHASVAQKHGIITKEFFDLMSGMRSMILKSIKARIEMHWK